MMPSSHSLIFVRIWTQTKNAQRYARSPYKLSSTATEQILENSHDSGSILGSHLIILVLYLKRGKNALYSMLELSDCSN